MLKKISLQFLAILFFLSITGMTFVVHTCTMSSSVVMEKSDNCSEDEQETEADCCGPQKPAKADELAIEKRVDPCCKYSVVSALMNFDSYVPAKYSTSDYILEPISITIADKSEKQFSEVSVYNSHSPPPRDITLLVSSFLI